MLESLKPRWPVWLLALGLLAPAGAAEIDLELRARLIEATAIEGGFDDRFAAEVWLTDMGSRIGRMVPDPAERLTILRYVFAEAQRVELPPEMVLAVIEVESAFDRWALSVAGARGLMQVMPFWVNEIGRPDDNLFDIPTNIRYGTTILRHYYDIERGNWWRALARYNGSLGQDWYPARVFRAYDRRWVD